MKQVIIILFICSFQSALCQQGENYLKLMNNLILVDSTTIKECFKNGKLRHTGLVKYYQHGDYVYEMNVGKHIRHYRDGSRVESFYDNWGTNIFSWFLNREDIVITEHETTKVETTAIDLDAFFKSNKHITYNVYYKDYRYDYDTCKYYLRKEGEYSNSKRIGLRKFYEPTGDLQKVKQF